MPAIEGPWPLRADQFLNTPIGSVVYDEENDLHYVFVGWRRNTAGWEMIFCEYYYRNKKYGMWRPSNTEPRVYHASGLATLLRKFPDLKRLIPAEL